MNQKKRVFCKDCKHVKTSVLSFLSSMLGGRYHRCKKLNSYNTQRGEDWIDQVYQICEEYEEQI